MIKFQRLPAALVREKAKFYGKDAGAIIREIRAHLTQDEFGAIYNITPQYVSALENGKKPVSRKLSRMIEKKTGIPAAVFSKKK